MGRGFILVVGLLISVPNFAQIWVARYNGPADSNDCAYAIAVDGSGNVYVTGESFGSGTNNDYATIKYSCEGGVGVEEGFFPNTQYDRLEAYPNPFIRFSVIGYRLSVKDRVSLKIYDLTGRLVRTLVNDEMDAGYHTVRLDTRLLSSGIYFINFQAGDSNQTKKIVLTR